MSPMARRVALLARPGVACERLRGALVEAGADLVLEADPLTLDPATLEAAQAHLVLVALDTQTEAALDRLEAVLLNPAIEVMFEEAELAARREGWEAARWVRHLAAKLHRHDDVLPPGAEAAATVNGGSEPWPVLAPAQDDAVASDGLPSPGPATGNGMHAFDPLFAEMTSDAALPPIEAGLAAPVAGIDPSSAFDPSLNFSYDGDFDSVAVEAADTFAGLSLDVPGGDYLAGSNDPGFDAMFGGDFAIVSNFDADAAAVRAEPVVDVDVDAAVAGSGKRVLELLPTDDEQSLRSDGIATAHQFKHDLARLESSIAGMELVQDRIVKGPAQANGAVMVLAGIGGPDAVRQFLGALPEDFPRPVLVQQRLDGGRYDKLVAQMQRATTMPVKLAEPGLPAIAGLIYILPAGVGIKVSDVGIQFIDGDDDLLAVLPSADSAVLMLSGSDPALVDAVMNHSWAGALVIGQAPDGCYDAAAPTALLARGGGSGQPAELAERLSQRWRS